VNKTLSVLAALTLLASVPGSRAATWPAEQRFRDLYQELDEAAITRVLGDDKRVKICVRNTGETNTTQSTGSCTLAAERMAARLKARALDLRTRCALRCSSRARPGL
jgi:hypothetical protein